jgi:glycosyltransferase involved in cell wall biosynthesis
VAVNARLLSEPTLRGWSRYTLNLLAELPANGVELLLYGDDPLRQCHLDRLPPGSYEVRVRRLRYPLWEQYWLPRQCARDGADVLHCPFNFGLPWFAPCPRVLTLHDAIDQVYGVSRMTWRDRLRHWISRRAAGRIITVSEHARGDLVRHLGLDPRRVTVIPEAADPRFHEPVSGEVRRFVRTKHGLSRSYFFYVGGWEQRKNVPFLLTAFAAAGLENVELVLAGGRDDERGPLSELGAKLGLGDRLRLLGWVADEDLPALYAEATAFVYPSAYEGFGLQVCEAMAVGCPVLAADATALPEVLGDGGDTFPLDRCQELAALLRRVAGDQSYRNALIFRGRRRSADYSWRRTAQRTVELYRALLAK